MWADRLADLDRLLELRWFGALPPGHRDAWMLLAGAALSWMIPSSVARREARMLAIRAIGGDWGEREVEARLGEVLARAESAGRGETVVWQGVEVDPRYKFRTATIIEVLQITGEEQRGMRTLFGPAESARRYQEHQAQRWSRGGRARAEKVWTQNRERDARIIEGSLAGESNRAIARVVGVDETTVRRVLGRVRSDGVSIERA